MERLLEKIDRMIDRKIEYCRLAFKLYNYNETMYITKGL